MFRNNDIVCFNEKDKNGYYILVLNKYVFRSKSKINLKRCKETSKFPARVEVKSFSKMTLNGHQIGKKHVILAKDL